MTVTMAPAELLTTHVNTPVSRLAVLRDRACDQAMRIVLESRTPGGELNSWQPAVDKWLHIAQTYQDAIDLEGKQ